MSCANAENPARIRVHTSVFHNLALHQAFIHIRIAVRRADDDASNVCARGNRARKHNCANLSEYITIYCARVSLQEGSAHQRRFTSILCCATIANEHEHVPADDAHDYDYDMQTLARSARISEYEFHALDLAKGRATSKAGQQVKQYFVPFCWKPGCSFSVMC